MTDQRLRRTRSVDRDLPEVNQNQDPQIEKAIYVKLGECSPYMPEYARNKSTLTSRVTKSLALFGGDKVSQSNQSEGNDDNIYFPMITNMNK